jgi:hypothetical protein
MISPFITHRNKVLGNYGAASFLRSVVLAMYNGQVHKIGLSGLTNLDGIHLAAFLELTSAYSHHGENDEAFLALASECLELTD